MSTTPEKRYFKSERHLANFLIRFVAERPHVFGDNLMAVDIYVDALTSTKLADDFGLALGAQPGLLHEDEFWPWLAEHNSIDRYAVDGDVRATFLASEAGDFHPEFVECCQALRDLPGIYLFSNVEAFPLYLGMSASLGYRLPQSFHERVAVCARFAQVFLRYIVTKNPADASVLEAYLIPTLRPALNKSGKYLEQPTLALNQADFQMQGPIPVRRDDG